MNPKDVDAEELEDEVQNELANRVLKKWTNAGEAVVDVHAVAAKCWGVQVRGYFVTQFPSPKTTQFPLFFD